MWSKVVSVRCKHKEVLQDITFPKCFDNSSSSRTQSPNDKLDTFAVPFLLQLHAKDEGESYGLCDRSTQYFPISL